MGRSTQSVLSDEISSSGAIINGFDYKLQVWIRKGIVENCNHPTEMGPRCCNQRRYAGESVISIQGHEIRDRNSNMSSMEKAGLRLALMILDANTYKRTTDHAYESDNWYKLEIQAQKVTTLKRS